jgi:DNA-binding NtrC family response regulator
MMTERDASLPKKLLVVDDDRVTRELLKEIFEGAGWDARLAASGEAAALALREESFPVVLSDIRMLDVDGHAVLEAAKHADPRTVVILMTGFGTMEGAMQALQRGAFDYISKPFRVDELRALVERAFEHRKNEMHQLAGAVAPETPRTLIGKSPRIVDVYKTMARATMSPSNVLIVGESGTGKELVARGIHEHSPRSGARFVAINCGALTETLLESELFGHVRGAFTGAIATKRGLFAEAHGGTLFLDEIGDISPALQVKLLRTLQEGEYRPVGSAETLHADVRVIAATHRDLDVAVAEGRFREDLYYRLKVIRIDIPALRERVEDIPELASHFLARYAAKVNKPISHIAPEAMTLLQQYAWPGNVRELEHAIERAVTMTRTSVLYPEDFPPEIGQGRRALPKESPPRSLLDSFEREHIFRTLEETGFNRSKAAAKLGIDRKTLLRRMRRLGIETSRGRR